MKRQILAAMLCAALLTGCGSGNPGGEVQEPDTKQESATAETKTPGAPTVPESTVIPQPTEEASSKPEIADQTLNYALSQY